MTWKKIILPISIVCIILYYVFNTKSDNYIQLSSEEKGFLINIFYEDRVEKIYPWYDETTGIWEIFLPSYLNTGEEIDVIVEELQFLNEISKNNRVRLKNQEIYEISKKNGEKYKVRINLSKNVPALFIETESGDMQYLDTDKDHEECGRVYSVNHDGKIDYCGDLESISGRGNGTWEQEKKPYNLKLAKYGQMAGLNPAKEWALLAFHYEGDKIHSKIAYDLEKILGGKYPSECTWVDVYFNGKYNGIYLLIDSVKERAGFDFKTNGFLVEKELSIRVSGESIKTNTGGMFEVKKCAESNVEDILCYIQECEDTIYSGTLEEDKIDIESFAIQFLVDMISMNNDSFKTSSFYYKFDGDNKIYAGPSWDYDGAFAEYLHHGADWINPQGTIFIEDEPEQLKWFEILYDNPVFYECVIQKFRTHSQELLCLANEKIDEYAEYIECAVLNDDLRWKFTDGTKHRAGSYQSWSNDVRYLQYFMNTRLQYLADLWEIDEAQFEWESTGEMHKVKFLADDKVLTVVEVEDGTSIQTFPDVKGKWCFDYSGERYLQYLPILEDCTLVLK